MRAFSASLALAAIVASPAFAAPIAPGRPDFILPRQGGPVQGLQSSQPLSAASATASSPSILLPLPFRPIDDTVQKREPVQLVSFIPNGAALDGTGSASASPLASAPASTSTSVTPGVRPVSFIPVGAALGGNTKREPVQSPPIVAPGSLDNAATESASTASASATAASAPAFRPVSFIPVGALSGNTKRDEVITFHPVETIPINTVRSETVHPVSFIPVGALDGNAKRDEIITFHPVETIPINTKRQESTIPPAGSAPGTVPASVTYMVGSTTDGPMLYAFQTDGSVIAAPATSGTV